METFDLILFRQQVELLVLNSVWFLVNSVDAQDYRAKRAINEKLKDALARACASTGLSVSLHPSGRNVLLTARPVSLLRFRPGCDNLAACGYDARSERSPRKL